VVLKLCDQRILPARITAAERLDFWSVPALFPEAEFLIDQAQYPAIRLAELGELLEVAGDRGGLPVIETKP